MSELRNLLAPEAAASDEPSVSELFGFLPVALLRAKVLP